ncbi:LuxR C-terminal-related transcriptional regulator [Streptomyces spectabilis]|uniref:response regulator transcription factor n=1 Tax=Streptomyces spectabilis TaxID=68270 RepID=UPI0033CAC121
MSALITLRCNTQWRYGGCTSQLITDARSLEEARTAASRIGWNCHRDGRDHCPGCTGRGPALGTRVAHLHPADGPAPAQPQPQTFTAREREVLRLLANGYTNAQIGRRTGGRTVDGVVKQLSGLFRRLGARDRVHAASLALAAGVLTPSDIQPHTRTEASSTGSASTAPHNDTIEVTR